MNYFNYFSEIEETFNRRRGKHQFLSPLDWALIESWQERKVPLHIVLRGIERVFDRIDAQPKRRRSVKSLTYCREEIEAQYEEWSERQTGKSDDSPQPDAKDFSKDAIESYLENTGARLEKARDETSGEIKRTLEKVLARFVELRRDSADAENLENALGDLEKLIDDALLEMAGGDEKSEIEKQMAAYRAKMDANVYRQTFDLLLLKKMREQAGIPRLSLFYL